MAVQLADTLEPKNNGNFPVAKAEHIEMPDGSRLSAQPIIQPVTELPADAAEHPNILYVVVEDAEEGGDAQ